MSDDEFREQDRYLPVANVARLMKKALPDNSKIAKEAKDCIMECVSEFISFITSEASDRCVTEKRKTINGEDILWAMQSLGFDNYCEVMKIYLHRYRESLKLERAASIPPHKLGDLAGAGGQLDGTASHAGTADPNDATSQAVLAYAYAIQQQQLQLQQQQQLHLQHQQLQQQQQQQHQHQHQQQQQHPQSQQQRPPSQQTQIAQVPGNQIHQAQAHALQTQAAHIQHMQAAQAQAAQLQQAQAQAQAAQVRAAQLQQGQQSSMPISQQQLQAAIAAHLAAAQNSQQPR